MVVENCGVCGGLHSVFDCNQVLLQNHVIDKQIPSKARLTLPQQFSLELMTDGRIEVFARENVVKGSYFGPLEAPKIINLNPIITFPLKLFSSEVEDLQECFLDTTDEQQCNWLMFINPASNIEEQNMICFQNQSSIMYAVTKNIERGMTLKVWYSPYYAKKMKMPLILSKEIPEPVTTVCSPNELNSLLTKQQNIIVRENWTCKFCSKLENNVINFANHMLQHYTEKSRLICSICKQRFSTKLNLQKHIKVVHTADTLKQKKSKRKKALMNVQNNVSGILGGPLLNTLVQNDSQEATNLLTASLDLNKIEMNCNGSIELLENDYSNLIESNDKELKDFHFEINEKDDVLVCDICLKPFSKLKTLIQHLRSHTGKYTCLACKKVFSRNENLKAHTCTYSELFKCNLCNKTFPLAKYLRRHIKMIHGKKVLCSSCKKTFNNERSYKIHKCFNNQNEEFKCNLCDRVFKLRSTLQMHLKHHDQKKSEICDICGKGFIARSSLNFHFKTHGEPPFSCSNCNKKFYRKKLLLKHELWHSLQKKYACDICNVIFTSKKKVLRHSRNEHPTSSSEKPHKCFHCNCKFAKEIYLKRHLNRHNLLNKNQLVRIEKDKKQFSRVTKCFSCPFCHTIFKLRGFLIRHIKSKHLEQTKMMDDETIKSLVVVINVNEKSQNISENIENNGSDISDSNLLFSNEKEIEFLSGYNSNLIENKTTDASSVDNNLDDIVRNLESVVNIYNKNSYEEILQEGEDGKIKSNYACKNNSMLIDFTDIDTCISSKVNLEQTVTFESLEDTDICLSMPDLNHSSQEPLN